MKNTYLHLSKCYSMESSAVELRSKVPRVDHHNVPFYDVVGMLQNPLVLRQQPSIHTDEWYIPMEIIDSYLTSME